MKCRVYPEGEPQFPFDFADWPFAAAQRYCKDNEDPNKSVFVYVEPLDSEAEAAHGLKWSRDRIPGQRRLSNKRVRLEVQPSIEWSAHLAPVVVAAKTNKKTDMKRKKRKSP